MRRGRRFQSWQAAADHFEQDLRTDSTEVTLKYIGVDLDDMRAAMSVPIYC